MILKVQSPLSDPTAMWLVYSEGKTLSVLMHRGTVPERVREAVAKGKGKAYFDATVQGKAVTFGAQAGDQPW
jgi:hypothetical protein